MSLIVAAVIILKISKSSTPGVLPAKGILFMFVLSLIVHIPVLPGRVGDMICFSDAVSLSHSLTVYLSSSPCNWTMKGDMAHNESFCSPLLLACSLHCKTPKGLFVLLFLTLSGFAVQGLQVGNTKSNSGILHTISMADIKDMAFTLWQALKNSL